MTDPMVDDPAAVGPSDPRPAGDLPDAPDSDAPAALPPRRLTLVAVVSVAILLFDQLTKTWALRRLSGGRTLHVVGSLDFALQFNTGTAFSLGSGKGLGPWISVLAIGVVIVLALGYTSRFTLGATAAGLIAGGAVGNLADRAFRGNDGFLHGGVVDFVALHWWPTFNLADAAICIGAALLVLASLRAPAP